MSFEQKLNDRLLSLNSDNQDKLSNLWKVFGLESEAGKKLFMMYNSKQKMRPNIQYPKITLKPKADSSKENEDANKLPEDIIECEIKKLNCFNSPNFNRNPKIYSVPKRKAQKVIEENNKVYFKNIDYKLKPGLNRIQMIEDLQKKFKFANIKIGTFKAERSNVMSQKQMPVGKINLMERKYVFGESKQPEVKKQSEKEELNEMFDEIVIEIDQKQKKLEEAEKNGLFEIVSKLKWEIIERVSDLEKITKLLKKTI